MSDSILIKDRAQTHTLRRALKHLDKDGTGSRQHQADVSMILRRGAIYAAVVLGCAVFGFFFLHPLAAVVFCLVIGGLGLFDVWRVKQSVDQAICVRVDASGMVVTQGGQGSLSGTWAQFKLVSIQWMHHRGTASIDSMTFQDAAGRQYTLLFSTLPGANTLLATCIQQMMEHGQLTAPEL